MNSLKSSAILIAFEGTDGSGKSTIARAVYDRLAHGDRDLRFIDKNRPPTPLGYTEFHMARLREILWDYPNGAPLEQLGDRHWISLITAWFQATDYATVSPLIEDGVSCIVDGWYYKYLARFLLKNPSIAQDALTIFSTIRQPDAVIFLDVDPVIAAKRKGAFRPSESGAYDGGCENRLLSFVTYQNRVRTSYEQFNLANCIKIDTTDLSEEAVFDKAFEAAKNILEMIDK